jgi:competence protein ComEC
MNPLRSFSLLCAFTLCTWAASKPLEVFFIDTEGGQATLLVTPSKQSVLVDTGWPGFSNRDADRIAKAAKSAGVKAIDYLIITHYHMDHVGGVPQLAAKLPVKNFVDHGENRESGRQADQLFQDYSEAFSKSHRMSVKPGDKIPVKDLDIEVVTADGKTIEGSGPANSLCSSAPSYPEDKTENARSLGVRIKYGKFTMLDLGDLTKQRELDLVCPSNKLGTVDVYLTTHHGLEQSNAKELVDAVHPRVAIMNNGAKKGGAPAAWKTIKASPGLEDLWQVHYSIAGKSEANSPEPFIANLEEQCEGQYLKVTAQNDGSFTVWNSRNKYTKNYPAR